MPINLSATSLRISQGAQPFPWQEDDTIYVVASGQSNAKGYKSAINGSQLAYAGVQAWNVGSQAFATAALGVDPFVVNPYVDRGTWANATGYSEYDIVQDSSGNYFVKFGATGDPVTSNGTDADLAGGSDTAISWTALDYDKRHVSNNAFYLCQALAEKYGKTIKLILLGWGSNPRENWISHLAPTTSADAVGPARLTGHDSERTDRWAQLVTEITAAAIPRIDIFLMTQIESNSNVAASVAGEPEFGVGTGAAPDTLRAGGFPTDAEDKEVMRERINLFHTVVRQHPKSHSRTIILECQGTPNGNQSDHNPLLVEYETNGDPYTRTIRVDGLSYPSPPYDYADRLDRDLQKYANAASPGDGVDFIHHDAKALLELGLRGADAVEDIVLNTTTLEVS